MARVDPATGRPRGFMRMGRHPRLDSVLFTLDVRHADWLEANRWAGSGRGVGGLVVGGLHGLVVAAWGLGFARGEPRWLAGRCASLGLQVGSGSDV